MVPVIERLRDVTKFNSLVESDAIKIENIIPMKLNNYYRYSGSLTTPGCDEVVDWHLADSPVIPLSEDQLLEFQSVEDPQGFPVRIYSTFSNF